MSSRRNIPIYDRWKSLSSDLMLPVTSVSINWTWISEHYLQPSRNPSILVPPQTNIWTLLNSRAERILFGISVLFELLQKCLKTLKRLLYNFLTFSWHSFWCSCSSYGTWCYMVQTANEWRLDSLLFFQILLDGGTRIFTYTYKVIRTLNYQMKNLLITIKLLDHGTIEETLAIWHLGQYFL